MVLGTQGAPCISGRTISLLMLDLTTWFDTVKTANMAAIFHMSASGMLAYLYGNVIVGALAAWSYISGVARSASNTPEQKTLLRTLFVLNAITLLSSLFIVPQMTVFSPSTDMLPRMAFYSYPINMIALTLISIAYLKKYAWITPLVLFIAVNINLTGLASLDMLFDYGRTGIYWK